MGMVVGHAKKAPLNPVKQGKVNSLFLKSNMNVEWLLF